MAKETQKTDQKQDNGVFDDVDNPFAVEAEIESPVFTKKQGQKQEAEKQETNEDYSKESSTEIEIDLYAPEEPEEEEGAEVEQEAPEKKEEPKKADEPTEQELEAARKEAKRKEETQARIRALANEKRQLEAQVSEKEAALLEQHKQTLGLARMVAEGRLRAAQEELKQALAANDVEKISQLIPKVAQEENNFARLEDAAKAMSDNPPKRLKQQQQENAQQDASQPEEAPQAQLDWLNGKDEWIKQENYAKLPREHRKVILPIRNELRKLFAELLDEGFDQGSVEFYDELDLRMETKFGQQYLTLVDEGVDMLVSNQQDTNSPGSKALNTGEPQGQKTDSNGTQQQKGSSSPPRGVAVRSPGSAQRSQAVSSVQSSSPAKSVYDLLSKDEKRVYETMYASKMSKQDFARRLANTRRSQQQNPNDA